jgi:predicted GTPase
MPYGELERQAMQRFASDADLAAARCTIEEREEYEQHIALGNVVYAGVDYARVLEAVSAECDVLLWDGGNNDFPFFVPDLHLVLVDPLRAGDETASHPGETVLRMADAVVISKVDVATAAQVQLVRENVMRVKPGIPIFYAASPLTIEDAEAVRGRRVVVVEDGPTITHGGMAYGAGYVAAWRAGAREIVDPRPYAVGEIADVYRDYPHIGRVVPAVGYSDEQLDALAATLNRSNADVVIVATPADLTRVIRVDKPTVRVRYEFAEAAEGALEPFVREFVAARVRRR